VNSCNISVIEKEFKLSEEQTNTETEVEEVTEEVVEEQLEQVEDAQMQQASPRELLLQVFEQGARASQNWDQSQARIQCILALQQVENLADIPRELKAEINTVLGGLLQAGQLHFGLQQVLYPMVKELE
tara:strand:+ start:63 stop:449 length:387 start_codon:yes stop_codon:yes gene_type:complete